MVRISNKSFNITRTVILCGFILVSQRVLVQLDSFGTLHYPRHGFHRPVRAVRTRLFHRELWVLHSLAPVAVLTLSVNCVQTNNSRLKWISLSLSDRHTLYVKTVEHTLLRQFDDVLCLAFLIKYSMASKYMSFQVWFCCKLCFTLSTTEWFQSSMCHQMSS